MEEQLVTGSALAKYGSGPGTYLLLFQVKSEISAVIRPDINLAF